jgi:multiple sugar transport system permease protein/putative aldouronate transport system permease protein
MSQRTVAGAAAPALPARAFKGVLLTVVCTLVVLPFVGILSTSVASRKQIAAAGGFVLLPDSVSWSAYQAILAGGVVTRALVISVCITVAGTALSLACTTSLGYALSRPSSFAHKPLLMIVLFALLFGPGIIPTYLVVRSLHLLDSYWSLILPSAVSAFNVIVVRAFFMSLPAELMESARIDGAGELDVFRRVVLPLSRAALAVIALFYAVGYWNAFFNALLYLNDNSMWPMQMILRSYVVNQSALTAAQLGTQEAIPPQESIQMAILVVSIVPIVVVYPFLQRHFAKGVLTGAVKG